MGLKRHTEASLSEANFSFQPGASLIGLFTSPAMTVLTKSVHLAVFVTSTTVQYTACVLACRIAWKGGEPQWSGKIT